MDPDFQRNATSLIAFFRGRSDKFVSIGFVRTRFEILGGIGDDSDFKDAASFNEMKWTRAAGPVDAVC